LEFHEIQSKCGNGSNSDASEKNYSLQVEDKKTDVDEDEGELDETENDSSAVPNDPQRVLKQHPFVVTRYVPELSQQAAFLNFTAFNPEPRSASSMRFISLTAKLSTKNTTN
jgi:hypothetical protein